MAYIYIYAKEEYTDIDEKLGTRTSVKKQHTRTSMKKEHTRTSVKKEARKILKRRDTRASQKRRDTVLQSDACTSSDVHRKASASVETVMLISLEPVKKQ